MDNKSVAETKPPAKFIAFKNPLYADVEIKPIAKLTAISTTQRRGMEGSAFLMSAPLKFMWSAMQRLSAKNTHLPQPQSPSVKSEKSIPQKTSQ